MSRYLIMALFFGFCCVTGISGADGDYALDVPTVQAKDSKSESKKSSDSKSRDKSSRDSASKDNRSSDS